MCYLILPHRQPGQNNRDRVRHQTAVRVAAAVAAAAREPSAGGAGRGQDVGDVQDHSGQERAARRVHARHRHRLPHPRPAAEDDRQASAHADRVEWPGESAAARGDARPPPRQVALHTALRLLLQHLLLRPLSDAVLDVHARAVRDRLPRQAAGRSDVQLE